MMDLVKAGGGMMIPIVLASIIALTIILERLWMLRRKRLMAGNPLDLVALWREKGQVNSVRIAELERMSPLGEILGAGLRGSESVEMMRTRIEDAGRHVAHEMERYLNTLGTIALISPLLGLLGTVVGIIDVFQAITASTSAGAVNPELLAGGIAKALITTAGGIIVAVPAFIFHRYFRGLVDELVIEMERDAIHMIDIFHPDQLSNR